MRFKSPPGNGAFEAKETAIVGAACRLPGAPDEAHFRRLLAEGRCAVQSAPHGRWSVERFLHPRASEAGFSYSFAGGYLDAPFDFDPTVFGMSPREAAQVDPQQRLLMEVVWEALEDARIPPSTLAGHEVGVYVGASSLDYGNLLASDPAAIESHFMTGNTLSVVSNRISYAFDWRGPSFTVDTACSSSLVAFSQALSDLRSGRIDTAVVAGVNMLLTPASFIGFSRASMLSPTGLCRPFSADGDGYVRGEGAVAFVLRRHDLAVSGSVRALAISAGVNSDGRTSGIALPGMDGQRSLLERLYGEAGLHPDQIAFVEAHGTGTRVGDPVEAHAIGSVLGRGRAAPLPIGSVKSNIGHLEPAAGVAGLLKALHALESRELPRSLHLETLNPLIDFSDLNLLPARAPVLLDRAAPTLYCGVSAFGFGGTNAHVILASAPPQLAAPAAPVAITQLTLSAATAEALTATAGAYARLLDAGTPPARLATAVAGGRETLRHRVVQVLGDGPAMAKALHEFAATGSSKGVAAGTAPKSGVKICFAFSGNGAQYAGMGRTAYQTNAAFRERFDAVDAAFHAIAGGSVKADLFDPTLEQRIGRASVAQYLMFAVQSATTAALAAAGLRPDMVLGHSIGEVAAAEASGAIDLAQAARIIHARATTQEAAHGKGLMAVFAATRERMDEFLAGFERDDIEIAADNGPSSITLSGTGDAVRLATRTARKQRIASRTLDLEYPFHSRLLDGTRTAFLAAVGDVRPKAADAVMISTVTGGVRDGQELDTAYWWRNVREPVLFRQAVEAASEFGAGLFIEIGPRPILLSPLNETLKEHGVSASVISSLLESDDRDPKRDPIAWIAAQAHAYGAALSVSPPPAQVDRTLALPHYPWQRTTYRFHGTSAALDLFGDRPRHPLIGGRLADGQPEWRTTLDAEVVPYLADHVVGGEVVVPGAAIVEMVLAVARDLRPEGPLGVEDCDIFQPLVLAPQAMREISVRYASATNDVALFSRPRFGPDEWTLHARGRLVDVAHAPRTPDKPRGRVTRATADEIYARTEACGLGYGPAFRLAKSIKRDAKTIEVELAPAEPGTGAFTRAQLLHPASLDAALHGLFLLIDMEPGVRRTYLPIRLGRLALFRDHPVVTGATITVDRHTEHSLKVHILLKDADGAVVAEVEDALLKSVVLSRADADEGFLYAQLQRRGRMAAAIDLPAVAAKGMSDAPASEVSDGWLMLRAFVRAVAHRALWTLADEDGRLQWTVLTAAGKLAPSAVAFAAMLAEELAVAELATAEPDGFRLAADSGLPTPDRILRTFAAECPGASAELLLAARTAAEIDGFLASGTAIRHRGEVLEQFSAQGLIFAPALHALTTALSAVRAASAGEVPHVLVAEADGRGLLTPLLALSQAGQVRVTVAGLDAAALERLSRRLPAGTPVEFLALDAAQTGDQRLGCDLALVQAWRLSGTEGTTVLGKIAEQVAPNGALLVAQPAADPVIDFLMGTDPAWFSRSADPTLPLGQVPSVDEMQAALAQAGCRDIRITPLADGGACLVAKPPLPATTISERPIRILPATTDSALAGVMAEQLRAAGLSLAASGDLSSIEPSDSDFVCLIDNAGGGDRQRTEQDIAHIISALGEAGAAVAKPRLWLVVRGANTAPLDPVADALWGFGRVAMNEFPDLDIRLVDIAPALSPAEAARRLSLLLATPDAEREVVLDAEGVQVLRVHRGLPVAEAAMPPHTGLTLEFPRKGVLDHFTWVPKPRVAPGRTDIEVEVVAAGLNFRDVMLAMGLLDDDVLDDGMAGAVFGFECVGRVAAVGAGVRDLAVGDMVVGFAKNAFSSHVTAPRRVFMPLPAGTTPEGAAGIPVAFLTAWYGLMELAKLKRGERVLIHGAAGGVGLAAIQIARARGAIVIATVSTPDKRALVQLFGADEVHDSRSLAFADDIRQAHDGVDVVLNSLSGEAMRASFKCLKPFGRFVELGKRDYVANTELGLRPFRRNLTYFGVDLDQLLAHDPKLVAKGLKDLASGFDRGIYAPLPHRTFAADEIGEAFRLMQSAAHVGKIVIRPPAAADARVMPQLDAAFQPGNGVQLVVGGAGGFGFETAVWLANSGAKHVVVASRRGAVEDALVPRVTALRAKGITFAVEQVDASDSASVEALITRVAATYGPITGVYHTAMVLQDGLIRGLDPDKLAAVLAPKIDGAHHLDRATRGQPVAQFVLFSSISALIGNPGQAAYVAANAYLEGLARQRRAEGLPALAVGWGAIADAGVLTREQSTAEQLERISGITGLSSADALSRLGRLLQGAEQLTDPVVYCARWQRTGLMRDLPILASPAFADVFADEGQQSEAAEVDLGALIADKSDAEAQKLLGDLIAGKIARILRLSAQEIDPDRPFADMGMDSLMALELSMNIEHELGVGLPLVAITSVPNLRELSRRLLQSVRAPTAPEAIDAGDRRLIAMHGGDEADFAQVGDRLAARRDQVTRVM